MGKIKTPSTSRHKQKLQQLKIFGPSDVKSVHDPHSDMYLEIGFCEHYCVQMTLLIPDTIRKCSLEREYPFMTKFV